MSDRLVELFRQRAVLQQQLADLDRQIADASTGSDVVAPAPAVSLQIPSPRPRVVAAIPPAPLPADPEAIISQYSSSPRQITTDVRKGCLLYAAIAFLFLALGIYALVRFFPH